MSTRRDFLKTSFAGATAFAGALAASPAGFAQPGPSDLKIAAIGVGGSRGRWAQGGNIARAAASFGRLAAVCDVDDVHTAEFNQSFDGKLTTYRDYRDLLEKEKPDVVTIGTPDHWHVAIAIAALRAGCDVYCEKPLTLTIDEGIAIREVVRSTDRVFQVGTQQRSEFGQRFLQAIAMVQSGRLGKNVNAFVAIEGGEVGGPFESEATPDGLDWNRWVGPARQSEYCERRRRDFRWFYDYSGGKLTDWGAHHIDIAQWALGHDHSGPVKVVGHGKFTSLVPDKFDWRAYFDGNATMPNGFHTATQFSVDLAYANGSSMNVSDRFARDDGTAFSNGILFEGDEGRLFVNRERLTGKPVEELTETDKREMQDRIAQLYKGELPTRRSSHMRNFFDSIASRREPVSDVETHHRTMTTCHLSTIALMLARELRWDPGRERFIDDPEAETFRTRPRREGFELT